MLQTPSLANRLLLALSTSTLLIGCTAGTTGPVTPPSSTTTSVAASASRAPVTTPNAADEMFVQMMIPHHEQAVELSGIVLGKQRISGEVRALAETIRGAQQPEIDTMNAWLSEWGVAPGGDHSDHGGTDGMLSEEAVAALREAQGKEATTLFLQGMIEHHAGAVVMAEAVFDAGQHTGVRDLARAIITSQSAEIKQMQELLAG